MSKKVDLFIPLESKITDNTDNTSYILKSLLGRGAFAQCYLAEECYSKDTVALKVVKLGELKSKKVREKLETEIQIHLKLNHPNIVKMYRSFRDDNFAYLVLEYCESGSLDVLLKKKKKFSNEEVISITKQLISALKHLHGECDVVHRDLKLGNLFIKKGKIKVGDFGLAAIIGDGQKKTTVCGTPNYIAPEVLFDKVNGHSFEVDIWSYGVILYTLLIGVPPFQKKEVKEIYKMIQKNSYIYPEGCDISPSAKRLIDKILSTDPMERPSLDQILHSDFVSAHREANSSQNTNHDINLQLPGEYKQPETKKTHLFTRIADNLKRSPRFSKPTLDYLTFSIPISSLKGIGYILKSNYYGIYFNDHSNILYKVKSNTFIYIGVTIQENKKILKKEEHLTSKVPISLKEKFDRLIFFIKNFSQQSNNSDISATKYNELVSHTHNVLVETVTQEEVKDNSFVVRVRRMTNGLIHVLWNENVCLDFNDGRVMILHEEGNKVYSFDKGGEIKVTFKEVEDIANILEDFVKKG
ncbi:PLK protein kinase [Anncaliia algerae PRA339]|uniref:Serine/threonine-protein kinase n=1 Tax=Anncaliia algerae PRA339 TaxID=1288291 RepID=A0A059EZ45_9MICR|nr:PLK protein kinase [Anncaliia algerae PRA339]